MSDNGSSKSYKKYKYKVKIWEKQFKKKYGRIPSKHDIREASKEIRYSYKMYYKLKTSLLEDTLNDVLLSGDEDGFDVSCLSQSETTSDFNISPQNLSQMIVDNGNNFNKSEDRIVKEFVVTEELKINQNAWGEHLSHHKKCEDQQEYSPPKQIPKTSLKLEMFNTQKLIKRYPRKSSSNRLSVPILKNNTEMKNEEKLPDLETILAEKSATMEIEKEKSISAKITHTPTVRALNEGWVNRCNSMNNLQIENPTIDMTTDSPCSSHQSYGITNVSLSSSITKSFDTGSIASNFCESSTSFGISSLNLVTSFSASSENICENIKNKVDSDEIVENSEDESIHNSSLHIRKKRRLSRAISSLVIQTEADVNYEKNAETRPVIEEISKDRINLRSRLKTLKYATEDSDQEEDCFAVDADSDHDDADYKFEDQECSPKYKSDVKRSRTNTSNKTNQASKTKFVKGKKHKELTMEKIVKSNAKGNRKSDKLFDVSDGDISNNTTRQEYVPEFGIDQIQNVPRADMTELKKNSKLFEEFLLGSQITSENNVLEKEIDNTNKEKLKQKMASGKVNENFVRLNIRKKVFVRGKKVFNFTRYKKSLWKKKKVSALTGTEMDMGGCDGGILICFQCGGTGHFAQQCKVKGDNLLELDAEMEDESPFPSLDEAAAMAQKDALKAHASKPERLPNANNPIWKDNDDILGSSNVEGKKSENIPIDISSKYIGHKIPEEILKNSGILELTQTTDNEHVQPIYSLTDDGTINSAPTEVYEALKLFGHTSFRSGQEKAIMRILSGQSTLVTLSTGSGKSLCYQLPAYLYRKKSNCCTLVISPLVSLMEDQVVGVPKFLNAQCLHTNQTPKVKEKIMAMINSNSLDVLLISPEAVISAENSNGFGSILRQLPPIAFACIDEVHCVSQWSHNFRPSYLMICRVLKEKLKIKTILGLTATATSQTRESIVRHLQIPDGLNGIISDIPLPTNLILTVSRDENRDRALIEILQSKRFENCNSIIIYCTRRDECERIASFVRTCLRTKNPSEPAGNETKTSTKRKRSINWDAEPYHAGLVASRRRTIQNAFMSGDLRIVVATVAFGMGINKADIRAVIHYNMPKSYESYVQEVGRAGRDGISAQCHLFLDSKGSDQNELRRHIFANSIDRHVIRKLLQIIFVPCACGTNQITNKDGLQCEDFQSKRKCPGHEISFSIEHTVRELDIPEENISTLLCYLELHENRYVQVLSKAYTKAKILSYGGPKSLKRAAQSCPPLAMAIAFDLKRGISHENSSFIEFPVIEIAAAIGWDSGIVKHQLKNLEWSNGKRSHITVNFFDLGFRVKAPGDLCDDELDNALDLLYERVLHQERAELIQLQSVFHGLTSVAFQNCRQIFNCDERIINQSSDQIKSLIREYFQTDLDLTKEIRNLPDNVRDEDILNDIYTMLSRYPENDFTGRTLARIFHGCQSPNYPAVIWGRCKFWRVHLKVDFNRIVRLANQAIFKLRRIE